MKYILFLALLCTIFLGSCRMFGKRIKGSGNVTTVTNNATGYNAVDVSGAIDVYVKNDAVQSVKTTTDDNLHEYLKIREEGGTLYISVKGNYNLKPSAGIKVYVSGPNFRKFEASGACDIFTEGMVSNTESIAIELTGASDANLSLNAPRISADLSGAGSLTLTGQSRDLELDGTGSTSFKCLDMLAENVNVDITGAGNAEVFASVKLEVSVSGAGSVKYKGNASVNQKVSGAGSVSKLE